MDRSKRIANIKVVHLVSGSLGGGAARGAYWLHKALLEEGIKSTILGQKIVSQGDTTLQRLTNTRLQNLKFAAQNRLNKLSIRLYRQRENRIFNTGFVGMDFKNHPTFLAADIVHLHWVNELVSTRSIRNISKPMVWTLRDMWPMTGGCHYAMQCTRYEEGCGACPQLHSNRKLDLTRLVIVTKRASFPSTMRVVGISSWLSACAEKSSVFQGFPIRTIGNGIDTSRFFPVDKRFARQALNLPLDAKIVLIGANNIQAFYKGFDLFVAAVEGLPVRDVHIVHFGRGKGVSEAMPWVSSSGLGFLTDEVSLRLAYSAADVFVAPSRKEAFGKTIVEAMACATPVVCFDATGPADIVLHRETGYKAQAFDAIDLRRGIEWVLSLRGGDKERLQQQSRERALTCFSSSVIAREYARLYKEMLFSSQDVD